MKVRVVHRGAAEYPPLLSEVFDPPHSLHVAGERISHGPCVAIVGARKSTPYGRDVATWLAKELTEAGFTIVSGLAYGIDTSAHQGALAAGGRTIAVLGSGVDVCYPRRNIEVYKQILVTGSVISEYPPGTKPLAFHFPARNRIIAGMSIGVVIVEARLDGGAMITARLAMEYGREVFAVPGAIHSHNSAGPHSLIRDGARLVTSPADILEELGFLGLSTRGAPSESLGPDETKVLDALGAEPLLLEQISTLTALPPSALVALISRLELAGRVRAHPGGRFSRPVGQCVEA